MKEKEIYLAGGCYFPVLLTKRCGPDSDALPYSEYLLLCSPEKGLFQKHKVKEGSL